MDKSAIALEKVSKTYYVWRRMRRSPRRGIREVSLRIESGTIFGLLGLNGAGKTTTMRLLVGLLRPDAGRVAVLGGGVWDPAVRARVGYVPELPYLPLRLGAPTLLRCYGLMSGFSGSDLAVRIGRALETVGLGNCGREPMSTFSRGMLQRVAVAQAILHGPKVLLADEPMSGLDPEGVREMRDLMVRLKGDGVTVFLNSHRIAEVERICDRVGVMAGGKIVREAGVGELLALARTRTYRLTLAVSSGNERRIEDVSVGEEELEKVVAARRKEGARVIQILAQSGSLEEVALEVIRENE